ncbi:hypothetical protein C2869_07645 [Saccharobesus litoralis]|uniref:Sulfatase N-terminal domain-containing protein n=1 Tax=Saccharobesus litoralis TaxID=2172099 RepID=A0A2S0VQ41_9ALTE|nr:sulfatase [Saccharobesus litoralis]AWB66313.1 hypothetical protein C2869_07645 [Saccharobesus litoralis]
MSLKPNFGAKVLRKLIDLVCVLILTLISVSSHAKQPPNIMIYLADDLSQRDISVYGNEFIATPELEKIAASGLVFNHAYVASPACAPSRAAMLTGLMPAKNGAEENHQYPRKGIKSLILNLKALGYEVAAFGKVAHGSKARGESFGFDYYKPHSNLYNYDNIGKLERMVGQFLKNRRSNRPLCLFVGTTNPHVPWNDPIVDYDPNHVELPPKFLDTPQTRRHRAKYYQQIKTLDQLAGRLFKMKTQHLGDNTLFIHSADHGSQWPFGKWTLYDYGTRVPFIAHWPGKIKPGYTNAMVSWVDLLPTVIEIAGGSAPDNIDGRSFKPVLLGDSNQHRTEIYTTTTADGDKNIYPSRALRTAKWKLIHNIHPEYAFTNHSDLLRRDGAGMYWHEWWELGQVNPKAMEKIMDYYSNPEFELYNIEDDPWEMNNLIDKPEVQFIVKSFKLKLHSWMQEQGDKVNNKQTPRLLNKTESWQTVLQAKKSLVN